MAVAVAAAPPSCVLPSCARHNVTRGRHFLFYFVHNASISEEMVKMCMDWTSFGQGLGLGHLKPKNI